MEVLKDKKYSTDKDGNTSKTKAQKSTAVFYLRRAGEGGHRGKYFPRQKGRFVYFCARLCKSKSPSA
ncbi:MAG: hypothetical protein IJB74_03920 [Clostridia bacterium]|nr:hypothetical protein [Clostridia bacterium]